MAIEIRTSFIPTLPIGCKVKVNEYGYCGTVTKHLNEIDTDTGQPHYAVQLNNDEYHTYYIEEVTRVR